MRTWIVQIRQKSRKEFPTTFWLQASDEEARELEYRIRTLFEQGAIKDFLFEPVEVSDYARVDRHLTAIESDPKNYRTSRK